jgi:diguanylate cyclase (GGDEF)-like protein
VNFLAKLQTRNRAFILCLTIVLIGIIGIVDFYTGYELNISLLYLMPVALLTWFDSQKSGIIVSLACSFIWLGEYAIVGHPFSHSLIPIWNTFIGLSFFIIITLLLSKLQCAMQHHKYLAYTDNLTGAVNSRLFFELVQIEVERLERNKHPFTLVYMDLDNFKEVNDKFGHSVGDEVLRTVVNYARNHFRKIDVMARLGGDEFVLLLPETTQISARVVLDKFQKGIVEEMHQHKWPVTFSMGVLTCNVTPSSTDELLKIADELMYSVKHDRKNAVKYSTYEGCYH